MDNLMVLNYGSFTGVVFNNNPDYSLINKLRAEGAVCKKENSSFIWYSQSVRRKIAINEQLINIKNGSLFPFQVEHVKRLLALNRALLAIDTGLGKTIEMCAVLNYVYENEHQTLPSLVVAPKSILENWANELEKHTNLTYGIYGDELFKKKSPANSRLVAFNEATVKIMPYSRLRILNGSLPIFAVAIFDEANTIKNPAAKVTKKAYEVKAYRKYLLTATPIKNAPIEIYSLARALDCAQYLFGNYRQFIENFAIREEVPFAPVPIITGYKNLDVLKELISPFSIFEKKTNPVIAEQIGKVFSYETKVLDIEQTELQEKINERIIQNLDSLKSSIKFEEVWENGELIPEELSEFRERILAYYTLARMASCSPSLLLYSSSKYVNEIASTEELLNNNKSNKIEEIIRILNDEVPENEKVVIFTSFSKFAEQIYNELTENHFKALLATGENNYVENISKFQSSSEYQVLVMTNVGKYGLNLQNASYLIFADVPFTYSEIEQIIGRIVRIGQKSVPVVYFLVSGIIEHQIYEYAMTKKEWNEKLAQEVKQEVNK